MRGQKAVYRVAPFEWSFGIKEHEVRRWPTEGGDCFMKLTLQKKLNASVSVKENF